MAARGAEEGGGGTSGKAHDFLIFAGDAGERVELKPEDLNGICGTHEFDTRGASASGRTVGVDVDGVRNSVVRDVGLEDDHVQQLPGNVSMPGGGRLPGKKTIDALKLYVTRTLVRGYIWMYMYKCRV
jgi:hypothetical protein